LIEKILRIINFWTRFRLSLPGRIAVFKTLLLSQISYGGCFLMPDPDQLQQIQTICNDFVLQRLRVSREKMYVAVDSGGLGLINIHDFIVAQQAIWIGRAYRSTRDCWRVDIHNLSFGNPLVISENDQYFQEMPTLKGITASFCKVRSAFYGKNDNYLDMYIFNNPLLTRGPDEVRLLDRSFFDNNVPALDLAKVVKLKFRDFLVMAYLRIVWYLMRRLIVFLI
jgi:hypothetical protein